MGSLWWKFLLIRLNVPIPWLSVGCIKRHSCVSRCGAETRHEGHWNHAWWMEYTAPAGSELLGRCRTQRSLQMLGDALQGAPWTHTRNAFCGDSAFKVYIWLVYPNSGDICKSSWYWLHYCSVIGIQVFWKSRVPLIMLVKKDNIDKARELCIYDGCTAETCLRILTGAGTGVIVSEFTLMLVPHLASRLHWLYHYTIWSAEVGVPQCPCGSVWTYPAPGMLSSGCDAEAATLPEQHYECFSVVRLMNAAEEWQQYSQTVASNMTILYCEGGPVFVSTVTSIHTFVAAGIIGTLF